MHRRAEDDAATAAMMTDVTPMPQPRTILIVFVIAHVVNDFYSTVLPAFLPAVANEFDLDYTELGILSFAFTALTGVLPPILSNVADRSGRRRWMLVFGFAVGAVGFMAMAAAPTFWFIVIVSLLAGLGGATYHPQETTYIVSAYPRASRPHARHSRLGWVRGSLPGACGCRSCRRCVRLATLDGGHSGATHADGSPASGEARRAATDSISDSPRGHQRSIGAGGDHVRHPQRGRAQLSHLLREDAGGTKGGERRAPASS